MQLHRLYMAALLRVFSNDAVLNISYRKRKKKSIAKVVYALSKATCLPNSQIYSIHFTVVNV